MSSDDRFNWVLLAVILGSAIIWILACFGAFYLIDRFYWGLI